MTENRLLLNVSVNQVPGIQILTVNVFLFQVLSTREEHKGPHINNFPPEILLQIFYHLDGDNSSLLSAELTCSRWKDVINEGQIYAKKCRQLLAKNPGNYLIQKILLNFHNVIPVFKKTVTI